MEDLTKYGYACMSADTIATDFPPLPGRVVIHRAMALYYFRGIGIESLFVDTVKYHHKKAVLLMFDNMEAAQAACDTANLKFGIDLQVKPIPIENK